MKEAVGDYIRKIADDPRSAKFTNLYHRLGRLGLTGHDFPGEERCPSELRFRRAFRLPDRTPRYKGAP